MDQTLWNMFHQDDPESVIAVMNYLKKKDKEESPFQKGKLIANSACFKKKEFMVT